MLVATQAFSESAEDYIKHIGTEANIQSLERVKQVLVVPPFLFKR
jgi:hypothetical protein